MCKIGNLKIRIALLSLLGLLIPVLNADPIPARMTLTYSFKSGIGKGQFEIQFTRIDDQLITSSTASPTGGAAIIFNDKKAEKVVYRIEDNVLLPIRYTESRSGRKKYVRSANLDWEKHTVRFSEAQDSPLPTGVTLDAGSFPTSLMWRPLPELANANGYIVGGKKIRAYRYSEPVAETLETPAGTFDTVRIEKQRIDNENRKLVIWVAPNFDNLPVRIEVQKGKKKTLFLLESANGIDLKQ